MSSPVFRRALCLSLAGHLCVGVLFSFSFGRRLPMAGSTPVAFWGQFLLPSELVPKQLVMPPSFQQAFFSRPIVSHFVSYARPAQGILLPQACFKPPTPVAFPIEKRVYTQAMPTPAPLVSQRQSVLLLHPQLPYQFSLYFRDRQIAHIALACTVAAPSGRQVVMVRRTISSGNLEADLLAMRSIERYLLMQQGRLTAGLWQTVKIELSAQQQ